MEEKTRSFIALELDSTLHKNLRDFAAPFMTKYAKGFRWVNPDIIHITLKFLGDVTASQISSISHTLDQISRSCNPFHFDIHGIGVFPAWSHPRTIWAGISPCPEMESLYQKVDVELGKLNFSLEGKKFIPHLTLCRVSDYALHTDIVNLSKELQAHQHPDFGGLECTRLVLFKSKLQAGGPIYSPLSAHPFRTIG